VAERTRSVGRWSIDDPWHISRISMPAQTSGLPEEQDQGSLRRLTTAGPDDSAVNWDRKFLSIRKKSYRTRVTGAGRQGGTLRKRDKNRSQQLRFAQCPPRIPSPRRFLPPRVGRGPGWIRSLVHRSSVQRASERHGGRG